MKKRFLITSKFVYRIAATACVVLAGHAASAFNYDVNFTSQPPVIDGSATDAGWGAASTAAANFVLYDDTATPSNQQTQVRLLWDSTYLYLMYEATDNSIVSSATGNDDPAFFANQDIAEIFLDPSWTHSNTTTNSARLYHISVDASSALYTHTEAGTGELEWDLSDASKIAFAQNGTNWNIEMAIAWSDLNSTGSLSPGPVIHPPNDGTIWGAQLARTHSMVNDDNNTTYSKWDNTTSGAFRARPFGTLSFNGGPAPAKVNLSNKIVNKVFGFEPPTYTDGSTVIGIENWTAASGNEVHFNASTTEKFTGLQSMRISAHTAGVNMTNIAQTENQLAPQYLQYALRLPSEVGAEGNFYRHVLYVTGSYGTGLTAGTMAQIWFRHSLEEGSNVVSVISYDNLSNTTIATRTDYAGFLPYDTWMWVTVKADPVLKQFNVWLNDTQLINGNTGDTQFGVRNRGTFRQMRSSTFYTKNYGVDPVYVDDVTFYEEAADSAITDWQLF